MTLPAKTFKMEKSQSTYKNFRRHETNSKRKELSSLWPVTARKNGAGVELNFTAEFGERVTFYLSEKDTNTMLAQLEKVRGMATT